MLLLLLLHGCCERSRTGDVDFLGGEDHGGAEKTNGGRDEVGNEVTEVLLSGAALGGALCTDGVVQVLR